VLIVNFLWSEESPSDVSHWDTHGHGTHVAGSIAGDDPATPGRRDPETAWPRQPSGRPGRRMALDDCADIPAIGCPRADLVPFFNQAYQQGARIHSNSWATVRTSPPTTSTPRAQRTLTPSCGASGFPRDLLCGEQPTAYRQRPQPCDSEERPRRRRHAKRRWSGKSLLANRVRKHSRRTDQARRDGSGSHLFGRQRWAHRYLQLFDCRDERHQHVCFHHGGLAALVREYFEKGYYPSGSAVSGDAFTPTAALLKAALIASATPMENVGNPPPCREQGWGRILLDDVLFFPDDSKRLFVADVSERFASSNSAADTYDIMLFGRAERLKVVLVWTDYPSTRSHRPTS